MRLFAAVRPPRDVLDHVERALVLARAGTPTDDGQGPVRWTPPQDRHLTLAFYGEAPDGAVPELAQGLAGLAAATAPFGLSLQGSGLFDRRTLWIGCGGDVASMTALMDGAVSLGAEVLGRQDPRPRSRAHLTVGRVRDQARRRPTRGREQPGVAAVAALSHALAVYRGPGWRVEEIELVRSELGAGPGGAARHEVLEVLRLGPPGP
ncbi:MULTISPECIES: RNA 2',3'-cyclic phosphodiesterase [unclassified Actinotalea]|uniref:RNA 2',3'-cyclic phosphodiesterase n=1 Tax=unclassified Actinotalea TaxID=2638618 RepID=UPI0015F3B8E0|nr:MULTISPECIES: RNA 2',3'-cyclic phosphodiesterase [unclassified Actinotalea]